MHSGSSSKNEQEFWKDDNTIMTLNRTLVFLLHNFYSKSLRLINYMVGGKPKEVIMVTYTFVADESGILKGNVHIVSNR